jgi:hypothetical protein
MLDIAKTATMIAIVVFNFICTISPPLSSMSEEDIGNSVFLRQGARS